MSDEKNVVQLRPKTADPEERQRRAQDKAEYRAKGYEGEWLFFLNSDAEELGIEPVLLKQLIQAQVRENKKQADALKAEQRRAEERAAAARKEEERKRKEYKKISTLPRAEREPELADVARRFDAPVEEVAAEYTECIGDKTSRVKGSETWKVEPWPEPVDTRELLDATAKKISRHVALIRQEQCIIVTLWIGYDWIHDLLSFSTFLVVASPEEDSGKSTLSDVVKFLARKGWTITEPTGPTIYRTVDEFAPTLIIDEGTSLFARKSDVRSILNASAKRGTYIPRNGYNYDPYCPKVINAIEESKTTLPRDLLSRSLIIRMFPALPGETSDEPVVDDDEFRELRRKWSRWVDDNGKAIVNAKPRLSTANRFKSNLRPLLAIAELAGEQWAEDARKAAEFILRGAYEPTWTVRLLATMDAMFQEQLNKGTSEDKVEIASLALMMRLLTDPLSPWHEYKTAHRFGKVSQNQIAALLKPLGICPRDVGPTKRRVKGYGWLDCKQMLARFRYRFPLVQDSSAQVQGDAA